MAKKRAIKQNEITQLVELLSRSVRDPATNAGKSSNAVVFGDLASLKANDLNNLRRKAEVAKVTITTIKKTLLGLALKEAGLNVNVDNLAGSVSLLVSSTDEVAPAKVLSLFAKENDKAKLLGGVLENKFISTNEVKALALIPSREVLIAKLLGSINAPLSGFVSVLNGNLRQLVGVLSAIKDQKAA